MRSAGPIVRSFGAGRDPFAALQPRLPPTPSREQVIQTVNANNSQIHSFSARNASLSGTGFPTLRATVDFQRPMRLRLRAETLVTGPELDVGSNDELFWFWVRRAQPPATYYCRHDEFASSPVRRDLPIDPYWLIEAFGIAEFDPRCRTKVPSHSQAASWRCAPSARRPKGRPPR